jgi:hypothetical protein
MGKCPGAIKKTLWITEDPFKEMCPIHFKDRGKKHKVSNNIWLFSKYKYFFFFLQWPSIWVHLAHEESCIPVQFCNVTSCLC